MRETSGKKKVYYSEVEVKRAENKPLARWLGEVQIRDAECEVAKAAGNKI